MKNSLNKAEIEQWCEWSKLRFATQNSAAGRRFENPN